MVSGEKEGDVGGVRVVSVVVKLRGPEKKGVEGDGGEVGNARSQGKVGCKASTNKTKEQGRLVRKYRSCVEHLN